MYDVIIVGAGPAGLSAALILGRCRRRVLLCDTGRPRNAPSHHMHGFLSRDGTDPAELRRTGREELGRYDTVELRDIEVTDAERSGERFDVVLADGARLRTRKLLLATGVVDQLPEIENVDAFYGESVWHCPYCHGWEVRDQPLAVYGRGRTGMGLALELTAWSRDLVLCTDGPTQLGERELDRLAANGIRVRDDRIARLDGADGRMEAIRFASGESLARRGMFFICGERQGSDLVFRLGCEVRHTDACEPVQTGSYEKTQVPGLYVAGDASRRVQLVIVAAAEGAMAAFAINTELLREDLE